MAKTLRITPFAFAKMAYFMKKSKNECGSFAITGDPKQPFLITDFVFIKQKVTSVTVEFDDNAVAKFMEEMDDLGLEPYQYMRIWQHCHPGNSPNPSSVDEATFSKVFGKCDYAIMLILARDFSMYARLCVNTKLVSLSENMDIMIDYNIPFQGTEHEQWDKEYSENIVEDIPVLHWNNHKSEKKSTNIEETNLSSFMNSWMDMDEEDIEKSIFVDHDGEKYNIHYCDTETDTEYQYLEELNIFVDISTNQEYKPDIEPDWMDYIRENKLSIMAEWMDDDYQYDPQTIMGLKE